jgi:starch synthase
MPLKICFAASEVAPFAKTGGLADVAAALPRQLHAQGHDVRVFLPLHGVIDAKRHGLQRVDFAQDVPLKLGWRTSTFSLWTAPLPGSDLRIYFIDCPELYYREAVYGSGPDEARRFAFLSSAVIASCQYMGWAVDLFHCNDWHTALIPLFLRTVYDWDSLFARSRTAVTIHNIGYQGVFPSAGLDELGLGDWSHLLDPHDLRSGRINFLKTGLIYADALTTVSPTYAREIQTHTYGMGLEELLRARQGRLVGILNGVDYDEWSPDKDRWIPHKFSRKRPAGKRRNKLHLLQQLQLPADPSPPLLGVISRFVPQKGFDLCFPVLPELLATSDLRLTVLGTGERHYEEFFQWLQHRFPTQVVYYRGYNNELAHLIDAGADTFLMPSRYEPCGLNQMFSLRYGTIPIVRRTGGLADSVTAYDPATGSGTGFVFEHFDQQGLHRALQLALHTYRDTARWRRLVSNAMASDYSWEKQAERYVELYRWLLDNPRNPLSARES